MAATLATQASCACCTAAGTWEWENPPPIANTGTVILHREVDRLFQPFQRLAHERTRCADTDGHGLGLAIVDAIARAHHATLTADPRPDGGLTVEVTFAPPD